MKEPTNRELQIMLDNLASTVSRIEETGKDTNAKATYTNGRVTHMEDVQKQNHEILVKHEDSLYGKEGLMRWKDRIWGMIKVVSISAGVVVFVLTALLTLFLKDLKYSLSAQTISLLEYKYDLEPRK